MKERKSKAKNDMRILMKKEIQKKKKEFCESGNMVNRIHRMS